MHNFPRAIFLIATIISAIFRLSTIVISSSLARVAFFISANSPPTSLHLLQTRIPRNELDFLDFSLEL